MEVTWAAWTPDAVTIGRHRSGRTEERRFLPRAMKADLRYFLRLYRLEDGRVVLRSSDGERTHLDIAEDGVDFRPVERWPDALAALPPYDVRVFNDGTVAGLSSELALWQNGLLTMRELPRGLVCRDVDRDASKRLWICGAVGDRRAFAVSAGDEWEVHDDAPASLLWDLAPSFRTIHVATAGLVLSVETMDIDPSTVVFVRQAKWHSIRLDRDVLRTVLFPPRGGIELISHHGKAVTPGKRSRSQTLLPRLRRLFSKDARFEILSAHVARGGERVLVVSLRHREERVGEAVVSLGERDDEVLVFHGGNESEIITACN